MTADQFCTTKQRLVKKFEKLKTLNWTKTLDYSCLSWLPKKSQQALLKYAFLKVLEWSYSGGKSLQSRKTRYQNTFIMFVWKDYLDVHFVVPQYVWLFTFLWDHKYEQYIWLGDAPPIYKKSFLCTLQAQTLPEATPLKGKTHPLVKLL